MYQKAMAQPKNNNTFIEVEWQGAQNEPRIELPEGPFVHSNQSSKKAWRYILHRFLYQGKAWLMIWGMAHATLQTLVVTRFMSPRSDISMEHTDVEAQAETPLWRENGSKITKVRSLDSMLSGAKRSAMCYRGKYHHTYLLIFELAQKKNVQLSSDLSIKICSLMFYPLYYKVN